jgi:hypothetical protein
MSTARLRGLATGSPYMSFCFPYSPDMKASISGPAISTTLFLLHVLLAGIQYRILLRSLQFSSIVDSTSLQTILLVLGTFLGIWQYKMDELRDILRESSFTQALCIILSNTTT